MKKILNIRSIVLIIFLSCICFMGFGFAKYSKNIGFSGNITIPSFFKVYISDIKKIDQEFINASGSIQSYSDNNAVLPVTATDVLFSATYLITVTNTYLEEMVFSGISIVPHVVSGTGTVDHYVEIINYNTGEKFYPGSLLAANSDTVLKMKIYYTSDSVVSISTDIGVVAIPESETVGGSLSKGNISRNTGSFDDHRTPECFTVKFINSYSYENVVAIELNNANYKVVRPNGKDFGNVQIPANSEKNVDYCIVPINKLTNRTDNVQVSYISYSSGESFSDNITFSITTLIRTFTVTTNMYDGIILCNNVTTGQYNIISATKTGSADVKIGETVECSAGDGNVPGYGQNKNYYYADGHKNLAEMWYNKWTIDDTDATLNVYAPLVCKGCSNEQIIYNQSLNSDEAHTVATTGTYSAPRSGYYLIELWGGAGGSGYNYSIDLGGVGGNSGYTYSMMYLEQGKTLYYTLGGDGKKGENAKNTRGAAGANGGGFAGCDNCNYNPGGGGGWSALFDTSTTGTLLMLSGGGGAGGGPAWVGGSRQAGEGGAGGNITNALNSPSTWSTTNSRGTIIYGSNGGKSGEGVYGTGATNSPGYNVKDTTTELYIGNAFVEGNANHAGVGGSSRHHGAPGGGGYYGGGGGQQRNNSGNIAKDGQKAGGGGGGASFISSSVTFSNLSIRITDQLVKTRPGEKNGDGGGAIMINFMFDTLDGV